MPRKLPPGLTMKKKKGPQVVAAFPLLEGAELVKELASAPATGQLFRKRHRAVQNDTSRGRVGPCGGRGRARARGPTVKRRLRRLKS